ncbi:MAG: alpha/beta hydrolase [Paucimonas sp.]|nr:alpha/beta hydrolase [Paucimonas sp.]
MQVNTQASMNATTQFATSNGIRIAYEALGDSRDTPLLLIMGLGAQLVDWPDSFCELLVDSGYYVIRFDNRDSGLSERMDHLGKPNLPLAYMKSLMLMPVNSGYLLDDMAADAIGLLDALDIPRAHVVGASMGGMIAQIMAARHPQRVMSLTSIMSTSGRRSLPGPLPRVREAMMARPPRAGDVEALVAHSMQLFRLIGSPGYPIPEVELRRRVGNAVGRGASRVGTARQLLAVTASGDRIALLPTIRVPTLVIHGSDDPLVPVFAARDVARLVPGAVLHEIPGMGHDLPPQLDVQLTTLIDAHCSAAANTAETDTETT